MGRAYVLFCIKPYLYLLVSKCVSGMKDLTFWRGKNNASILVGKVQVKCVVLFCWFLIISSWYFKLHDCVTIYIKT